MRIRPELVIELACAGDPSAQRALDTAAEVVRDTPNHRKLTVWFVTDGIGIFCRATRRFPNAHEVSV